MRLIASYEMLVVGLLKTDSVISFAWGSVFQLGGHSAMTPGSGIQPLVSMAH